MDACCTATQMALLGLASSNLQADFTWGFMSVMTFWGLAVCGRAAMDAIKAW